MKLVPEQDDFSSQEASLQDALRQTLGALDALWAASLDGRQGGQATGGYPFFRIGTQLGQFGSGPSFVVGAVNSRLAALASTATRDEKARIVALDTESGLLLARTLELEEEQELQRSSMRALESEVNVGRQEWIWIILCGFFSLALISAEFALAQQVTQEALLLRNPLVFGLALASATLAFKLLADRFLKEANARSHLIYVGAVLLLFLLLMGPMSILRTKIVMNTADDAQPQIGTTTHFRPPFLPMSAK